MTATVYESQFVSVEEGTPSVLVRLLGDWTIENAAAIDAEMPTLLKLLERGSAIVHCARLTALDTTGAVLIRRFLAAIEEAGAAVLTGSCADHKRLLDVVHCRPPQVAIEPDLLPWYLKVLEETGKGVWNATRSLARVLSFFGLVLIRLFGTLLDPGRVRLVPAMYQIEAVGLHALGIVGLISFLIGAVMVNQGAIQLAKFGADVFVIDMLGIIQLRELGVLLTAIIIAGRSGSAFTAQIGSMKLNEEIDAILTIGMNPIDVLVLPRLMALMIALPLLTFYADVVGVLGGVAMAWVQLDISPANFLVYFHDVIPYDHYMVGLIKAPFFAAIIASCGCYQGMRVEGSADSLGERTTRSVVQSIFMVIVIDALFAVFFTAVDL